LKNPFQTLAGHRLGFGPLAEAARVHPASLLLPRARPQPPPPRPGPAGPLPLLPALARARWRPGSKRSPRGVRMPATPPRGHRGPRARVQLQKQPSAGSPSHFPPRLLPLFLPPVTAAAERRLSPCSATVSALFLLRWTTSVQLAVPEAPPHPPLLRTSTAIPSLATVGLNFCSPRRATAAVPPRRASPPPH
jgi:hypothetical protein